MAGGNSATPMLQAALGYARRGWPVFPCNPKNKQPLLAADRDPITQKPIKGTGGVSKATRDEELIKVWWKKWPNAMIGLAMGHNGLFALDFDPRIEEEADPETGEVTRREWTLEQLKEETEAQIGCALPVTLAARTPSGGVHLYLRQPSSGEPIRNRGNLPLHVDVRGLGGYVIAPPSIMEDGREYRWLHGNWNAEIVDAPAELVDVLRAPKVRPSSGENAAADQAASAAPSPRSDERRDAPASSDDPGEAAKRRYAMGALERECELLAKTPLGSRNNQSNASGFVIGQLVGAGALGESFARAALYQAVQGFNDPAKAQEAVDNGLEAGMGSPRDLADVAEAARERAAQHGRRSASASRPRAPLSDEQGRQSSRSGASGDYDGQRGGRGEDEEAALNRKCAFYPQTDLGNLERFLARHGHDFLFVEQWGWLAWDGRRWNRDMAVPLFGRAVQRTIRAIQDEARAIRESGWKLDGAPLLQKDEECEGGLDYIAKWKGKEPVSFSSTIAAWGRTSESAGHLNCIAKLAEARLAARTDDFDADPLMLNVENGTIVFQRPDEGYEASFTLREHRREDRITKLAAVTHDPDAKCPKFEGFLGEVQPDPEMRDFLDIWAGYNSLGLADAQKMAIFYGEGSNGKGVWLNTTAFILGDYAWAAGIETFIDQGKYRKGSDASPDLAALAGRRMVYANEPEEGSKFSDGLIKAMTSDEPIGGVRELLKPPFQLLVTFTNTVSANHKPKIGTDHGIQRRVQIIPWDVIIPTERADPLLKSKLKAEASGIFNRMLRGALHYLTHGLPIPKAVADATRDYQQENDLLGQFIALCVDKAPGETVGAAQLHRLFAAWQTWSQQLAASGKPWSPKYLSGQMERKGYRKDKSSTMRWHDIALKYEAEDFCTFHEVSGKEVMTPREGELPPPRSTGATAPAPPSPRPFHEVDDDELP